MQETQYDLAGLELAGLAPPSPGIKGLNNYRFNGKEFQTDLGLAWNHQDWRFFDPQLLRWHVGDPELENGQESWSPYSFGYDNAIRYSDANGREPGDPPGAVLPAPSFLEQAAKVINLPDLLHDLQTSPVGLEVAEGGALLQTLVGLLTVADHLPTPNSQSAQPQAATLPSDRAFAPPATHAGAGDKNVTAASGATGVIYRRTNPETGEKYVGQAKSDERFAKRQKEHDKAQGVGHKYETLERAAPGKDLDVAEEKHIRAEGGPKTKSAVV